MTAELDAAEVAARRAEARIRADQYDLGLRRAALRAPGQTADEAARQQTAADALAREIKALRRQAKASRKEEQTLRARLGQQAKSP